MRDFVLLCLVLGAVAAIGYKKTTTANPSDVRAEIIRKILLVTRDAGKPYAPEVIGRHTDYLKKLIAAIMERLGIDYKKKISEQDANVLNIKDNNPRGPEFDKVVSTAREILEMLSNKASAKEKVTLVIAYVMLAAMQKNKVNDQIRSNLQQMGKKFSDFLHDIMIYYKRGEKAKIYSIADDIKNLISVLSSPKMLATQYYEAIKKIEDKIAAGQKKKQ